jgi:hypothetical protein
VRLRRVNGHDAGATGDLGRLNPLARADGFRDGGMVGRDGLEPPTSAVCSPERCVWLTLTDPERCGRSYVAWCEFCWKGAQIALAKEAHAPK